MTETKKTTKAAVKPSENKFAVIEIAGSQIKVVEGKSYDVMKLEGKKGDKLEIKEVLLVSNGKEATLGDPYVKDALITAEITSQKKGEKINGFKYSAKSRTRRHFGSRPSITTILIKKI